MGALRNIRHHIAVSVRKLLKSPRGMEKIKLRKGVITSDLNTPDSMQSVSFTESILWPYIDDDDVVEE